MAPEKHALLGASSAHRWMNCPPSAQLCADIPDVPSPYAEEGTKAHALCERLLLKAIGAEEDRGTQAAEPDGEMLDAALGYRNFVLAHTGTNPDAICVEQRVDFSQWVPEGFGTVDCLAICGNTLLVFDFKYGQGVEVDAERNPQMMLYALGGYAMFSPIFDIQDIEMYIYQPRREHISSSDLTLTELLGWAEDILEPVALLASRGEGDFSAGDWCRFCKAKTNCRELAARNMELAKLDFPDPVGMSAQDIVNVLPKLDLLIDWAGAVKNHALYRATQGERFPGYKLVEGRSVRKFRSETDACLKIKEAGFNPYVTKMKGLTELQKEMGKQNFDEVCGPELIKPAGKPVLVPETDKRPEMRISAYADFETE